MVTSHYDDPGCVHTHNELNPWWMVDLGIRLHVFAVNVTPRGDCCGEYIVQNPFDTFPHSFADREVANYRL